MSAEDNAALARAVYDAFSNDDFDRALDHSAEDVEVVMVRSARPCAATKVSGR